MKSLFVLFSLCFIGYASLAQSEQGGYLGHVDQTPDGTIFYVTEYLTCTFTSDVDKQMLAKKDLFSNFVAYLSENYELVMPLDRVVDQTSWYAPGRGVDPENVYNKKLENMKIVQPDTKIIIVEDYEFVCPTE